MVRIIDASVAIKWFVDEHDREKAIQILEEIINNPTNFAVPELFYFELAHIFNRLIINPSDIQLELLSQIAILGFHRFSATPALLIEIRRFQKLGLSGYDAAYVGLARMTKGKWITFDRQAHEKIAHLKLSEVL